MSNRSTKASSSKSLKETKAPENQNSNTAGLNQHFLIALNLKSEKKLEEALVECEKAIKIRNEPIYIMEQADLLSMLGRHKEALEACDRAIAMDRNNPEYHLKKGCYHKTLNQNIDALKEFNEAIKLDPEFWRAYWLKSKLIFEINEVDKAIEEIDKAIKYAVNS